jgi:Short C-terminal domain/Phospholipase_D-nuclease N-terminal
MADEQRVIPPDHSARPADPLRSIAVNVLAYDLVDLLWWTLAFFLFSTWICLFIVLLSHVIGSQDLSGWGKAFWLVCFIVVPLIGTLAYVIARRGKITKRQPVDRQQQAKRRGSGKDVAVASRSRPAVDVARLAELHDRGLLTDEEYVRQRMRALS